MLEWKCFLLIKQPCFLNACSPRSKWDWDIQPYKGCMTHSHRPVTGALATFNFFALSHHTRSESCANKSLGLHSLSAQKGWWERLKGWQFCYDHKKLVFVRLWLHITLSWIVLQNKAYETLSELSSFRSLRYFKGYKFILLGYLACTT